jgi:hypothetical protein
MDETEVHMIAGDGYYLACAASALSTVISMTEDFEKVTCVDCQIKWLTYERDQYKEMWEREKESVGNSPSQRTLIEMQQRLSRQATTIGRMSEELEKLRARSAEASTDVVTHRHNPFTDVGSLCGSYEYGDEVVSTRAKGAVSCKKCLALLS